MTGRLLTLAQLLRLPNVFTAISNSAMAFLLVRPDANPPEALAAAIAATCALYLAGMVLNDVYDAAVDAVERPARPIPSGRVALPWARRLGFGLLALGVAIAWGYAASIGAWSLGWWHPGCLAVLLAACVVAYDAVAKRSWIGSLVMGGCRTLNLWMAMGFALAANQAAPAAVKPTMAELILVAVAIGVYVAGVTWFARGEAAQSERGRLVVGLVMMAAGIGLLAIFPRWAAAGRQFRVDPGVTWPLTLLLVTFPLWRRCLTSIAAPSPKNVQGTIKHALLSLIFLDALIVAFTSSTTGALVILALLAPALWLGRWVYST